VSEYQYYEFRALDRRLTAEQQQRLRSLSSRAEISATRFANEYSFGDFRGDPGRLLEEYSQVLPVPPGQREQRFPQLSALTEREREVLKLVAEGYSGTEIAEKLVISPKTVDTYRERIMQKLGLRHRYELVRYALRKGMLKAE